MRWSESQQKFVKNGTMLDESESESEGEGEYSDEPSDVSESDTESYPSVEAVRKRRRRGEGNSLGDQSSERDDASKTSSRHSGLCGFNARTCARCRVNEYRALQETYSSKLASLRILLADAQRELLQEAQREINDAKVRDALNRDEK